MGYKFLKGVKEDRRFGKILTVNFNPYKVCNFNCIYCGIGPTTDKTIERKEFYPPEEIFREIRDFIEDNGEPDYVWLSCLGEPLLYSGFKQLSKMIKGVYPDVKIGVSSNGSLLYREDVRDDFSLCDLMLIGLDSISTNEFSMICRHHEDVKLKELIEGLKTFRKSFSGELVIVTVFLEGINDSQHNLQGLRDLLGELQPDLYVLKNYACRGYKSLDGEFKKNVEKTFKNLPFEIIYKF